MAMTSKKVNVGARVRQLRVAKNLTQMRLAALTGLNPMTITKAECANLVTWRTAKRLGDVFNVDPRDLVTSE